MTKEQDGKPVGERKSGLKAIFDRKKKPTGKEQPDEAQTDPGQTVAEQSSKWRIGRKREDKGGVGKKETGAEQAAGSRKGKKRTDESEGPSPEEAARLLHTLRRAQEGQEPNPIVSPTAAPLVLLRSWQSQRLMHTYADLVADPRYNLAGRFFLEDIYTAPRDFSQQGEDVQRIYRLMLKFLPARFLRPVIQALELYNLSEELDRALLEVLVTRLGMTDSLTPELYADAYRLCDNYALRAHQIELIAEVVRAMDGLARLPVVPATMRISRLPASRAGWSELHAFIERGVAALKEMGGVEAFVNTIQQRETHILNRIYAGDPDPFRDQALSPAPDAAADKA